MEVRQDISSGIRFQKVVPIVAIVEPNRCGTKLRTGNIGKIYVNQGVLREVTDAQRSLRTHNSSKSITRGYPVQAIRVWKDIRDCQNVISGA